MTYTILSWVSFNPSRIAFTIPFTELDVYWYGIFFALGFFVAHYVTRYLLSIEPYAFSRAMAKDFVEKLTLYVTIGTLIGARVGHILFYESIFEYLKAPLTILNLREGGLASHGAVFGIFVSLILFSRKYKQLSFVALLDLLVIPAAFVSGLIRLGNFLNQEILGIGTDLPWAIIFENPSNGAVIIPRHPVQIYESLFYFLLGGLFLAFSRRVKSFKQIGLTSGTFLIVLFIFRFLIEWLKEEQSILLASESILTMGQCLSIPMIFMGLFLCIRSRIQLKKNQRITHF